MRIVWDSSKRSTNIERHGFDFADLDIDFFAASVVVPAKSGRAMSIGRIGGTVIAVVFSPLGSEAISVVSMRRASKRERSIL